MRRPDRSIAQVYLHRAPIDMRKQMDGLAILVQNSLMISPFAEALFVFINRRRDKLKMLLWDQSGFIVWYKRLEREKFHWPRSDATCITFSAEQLAWLLEGYDVSRMKPHQALQLSSVC